LLNSLAGVSLQDKNLEKVKEKLLTIQKAYEA